MIFTSKILGRIAHRYADDESGCVRTPFVWLRRFPAGYRMCGLATILDSFVPPEYRESFANDELAFSYLESVTRLADSFDARTQRRYCLTDPSGSQYTHAYLCDFNRIENLIRNSQPRKTGGKIKS
jgi:hypothetical protein